MEATEKQSIAPESLGGLHFYFDDPLPGFPATGLRRWGGLGTRRAQTDSAGVIEQSFASLPFGDALAFFNPAESAYTASLQYPT
jgi:hypothetical protein